MSDNNLDLTVSRIIKAPPQAVWQAWSNPAHLEKWWAPAPVKTTVSKLDLRPGGAFASTMEMPDGSSFAGESCFLEVVENQRIVWTTALQGQWRPNEGDMHFSAIITMEAHPEGTKYTATALHKNAADCQTHAEMGFVDGWGIAIEQLGQLAQELA